MSLEAQKVGLNSRPSSEYENQAFNHMSYDAIFDKINAYFSVLQNDV